MPTLDDLIERVYDDIKEIARARVQRERVARLTPTELVHEAYARMAVSDQRRFTSERHFKAMAGKVMERVLIDLAREAQALKRGGGTVRVTLDEEMGGEEEWSAEIHDLMGALAELNRQDPQKVRVIVLREFGGLTLEETAEELGISVGTVKREFKAAIGWLRYLLEEGERAMNPEEFRRIDALLQGALALPASEQASFIEESCRDAAEAAFVARLVELSTGDALLGGGFRPAVQAPPLEPGATLGPYRVVREIGAGGMGRVYLAERGDGAYQARVAIKRVEGVPRDGQRTGRLLRERQLLAELEHPHIARLLDGGTDGDGVPYLVMEYVEGTPIDQYCDERALPVHRRLELLRDVCEAVAFIHRRPIVHRDLKPDNVLVTDEGTVKVLDFGIAKLLAPEDEAPRDPTLTRPDVRAPMTPDYACPEQLRGDPVTVAADVYALGVLAYELLSGHRRRDFAAGGNGSAPRRRAGEELVPPSAAARHDLVRDEGRVAAAELARRRRTTPQRLARELAGDLDAIVERALAESPETRYESVAALRDDLDRHLAGQAVSVRRGRGYRLRRFARRHWQAIAAGGLVVVALAGGLAAATVGLGRARAAEVEAAKQANIAEETLDFFTGNVLAANPYRGNPTDMTVVEAVERAEAKLDEIASDEVEAKVRLAISHAYTALGYPHKALTHMKRVERIWPEQGDRNMVGLLGINYRDLGFYPEATAMLAERLARFEREGVDEGRLVGMRSALAMSLFLDGRYAASEQLVRENLSVNERLGHTLAAAMSELNLSAIAFERGRVGDAERGARSVVEVHLAWELPPVRLELAHSNLSEMVRERGLLDEARRQMESACTAAEEAYGDAASPRMRDCWNLRGWVLQAEGRHAEAERWHRRALEVHVAAVGPRHPEVAADLDLLAWSLLGQGRPAEAERAFRDSLDIRRERLREEHPKLADSLGGLGAALVELGRPAEALPLLREAVEVRLDSLGAEHWRVGQARTVLGQALVGVGQNEEGAALVREGYAQVRDVLGAEAPETEAARRRWVEVGGGPPDAEAAADPAAGA